MISPCERPLLPNMSCQPLCSCGTNVFFFAAQPPRRSGAAAAPRNGNPIIRSRDYQGTRGRTVSAKTLAKLTCGTRVNTAQYRTTCHQLGGEPRAREAVAAEGLVHLGAAYKGVGHDIFIPTFHVKELLPLVDLEA